MEVVNLTTLTDVEFLQQSVSAMNDAIDCGNAPLERYWLEHARSFAFRTGLIPKRKLMYSEENELLAQAAYALWTAEHPNDPAWEAIPNKHVWRDLVLAYQRRPNVRGAIPEMEQCVVDVLATYNAAGGTVQVWLPAPNPEPVAEPEKPKAKTKKG